MLLEVTFPVEPFNTFLRNGTAGLMVRKIVAETKASMFYLTEREGKRAAIMVIEPKDPSDIPDYGEPWFLQFNAECRFRVAISLDDLGHGNLEELAKRWG